MELRKRVRFILLLTGVLCFAGCRPNLKDNIHPSERLPVLSPDYRNITIPPNIAPMNFSVLEEGIYYKVTATSGVSGFQVNVKSSNGTIRFPEKSWKKLLKESMGDSIEFTVYSIKSRKDNPQEYKKFYMSVASDSIDPYLVYRLIKPGYYSWSDIKIVQRSVESFRESSVFENQIMEKNCANCHSFSNNNPDKFMIHIRGSLGGSYFVEDGKITKTDPKIDAMPGSATYPAWHPGGRFMTFSSNQVRQSFYSQPEKSIEVFDLVSSLILYDRTTNEIFDISDTDTAKYLLTFPSWSPDGRYLYFCRAKQVINTDSPELEQIENTHYDIIRKSFDEESRTFGESEIFFDAAGRGKSASFPRISPDGSFMVFTLHDYGTFPIWHKEADLYLIDMKTGEVEKMSSNSDMTESYHSWSTNGRWLVFSSKRMDGRSARPHFVHIDNGGKQGKEFVLPQKDPLLYDQLLESFNIPEFVTGRIRTKPGDFVKAARQTALKAKHGSPSDIISVPHEIKKEQTVKVNEKYIHE